MSQPPALRINTHDVRAQFDRRSPLDAAQFLYGEIAQRMLQRLSYIRHAPVQVLDAGCGAGHALEPLRSRYSTLQYTGLDHSSALLNVARARHQTQPGLWQRLRNKPAQPVTFVQADLASSTLDPESFDMVWSNMALHWHPEPHNVLEEWRRILKPGALAMFSSLGPGSMIQLRKAIEQAQLSTQTLPLVDMHDFGDLLIERGFSDPVMDQEIITLTYKQPEKLLSDLQVLGGNPNPDRRKGLTGRNWHDRLLSALNSQRQADGTIHLTLEVVYGHAWRSAAYQARPGETRISVGSIGRTKR